MTTEQLNTEADSIESFIGITLSNEPEEIKGRINSLMVHVSRTGQMLADAKKILRARKSEQIQQTIISIAKEACLSAKVQNTLLDSICTEEAYLVDRIERLNRSCTHQLDACRSLLSYAKEELSLTKIG
jgi:hypothetical protein